MPNALLAARHLLTPNETEAELLTGLTVKNEAAAAKAAELRARGVENGDYHPGRAGGPGGGSRRGRLVPGFTVKAVDTTAAGDVFNGTLAVALAEGKSLLEAARFASAAAAISVTRLGAQTSAPRRRDSTPS